MYKIYIKIDAIILILLKLLTQHKIMENTKYKTNITMVLSIEVVNIYLSIIYNIKINIYLKIEILIILS